MTDSKKEYNEHNPWREEETLRSLYWDDGLTFVEIADRFDITHQAVLYWFDKHDIERRPPEARRQRHATLTVVRGHPVWIDSAAGSNVRVPVHRLLAIAEWGPDAVADMVVHHKNHIPWDNRTENLELMDPSEHIARHSRTYHSEGGPEA